MVELSRQVDAAWWAADAYEIFTGEADKAQLRPKPGAELRALEPMRAYEAAINKPAKRRGEIAPHLSFAALGAWYAKHDKHPPPREASELACSWAAQHGLPGLLFADAVRIVYPVLPADVDAVQGAPRLGASHVVAQRTGARWSWHFAPFAEVPESPGVTMDRPGEAHTNPLPLRALESYFPGACGSYPVIIDRDGVVSEETQAAYGEPLWEFFDRAARFDWALRTLNGRPDSELSDVGYELNCMDARDVLNRMAETGADLLEPEPLTGKNRLRWHGGTLLAAMAQMARLDLSRSAAMKSCGLDGCFNLFVPAKANQVYCSATCQNTAARRRFRRGGSDEQAR